MSRAEELSIPLAQGALAAKAWGDPALPPLLALHGWLDNAGSFDRLAPLLAGERYVVALDLRGHGRSSHLPPDGWYHYVDRFDELRGVFDHFGWARAGLLGHSLGGTLASLFAALYPERVDELLLIEALGPLTNAAEDALAQLRRALDQRAAYATRRPLRVFPDLPAAVAARVAANGLSETAARAIVERGVTPADGGLVWSSDPRLTLASPVRFTEAQVQSMLAGIRARTLLVLAEPETSYLPAAMMEARAAQVAGIRVVRLPGNHHLHLEDAGAMASAIRAFRG
ncbi:alpha/beta fold hydrolase [Dokdonella ginsengisoli]|uniref:Alpha/beta fold hydrolase n=1 Tax=Dokdonella ginsengisoli TaxID=363846 RepID=A0ABV9QPU6_9GAMM